MQAETKILLDLLHDIAGAKTLTDVNIAAGDAAYELELLAVRGMSADERRAYLREMRTPEDEYRAIKRERG